MIHQRLGAGGVLLPGKVPRLRIGQHSVSLEAAVLPARGLAFKDVTQAVKPPPQESREELRKLRAEPARTRAAARARFTPQPGQAPAQVVVGAEARTVGVAAPL